MISSGGGGKKSQFTKFDDFKLGEGAGTAVNKIR